MAYYLYNSRHLYKCNERTLNNWSSNYSVIMWCVMIPSFIFAVMLTFSFRLIETFLSANKKKYTVYCWGALVIALSFIIKENYVFRLPQNIVMMLPSLFINLILVCIISKYSGFCPESTFDRINFIITYPILEEIAFRGLILANLAKYAVLTKFYCIPFIMSLSLAAVISAFLFAVHLQFHKLDMQNIRFMIFAFVGGLFFGVIAQETQSIALTIPLHIVFNGSATYYSGTRQS